MKQKIYIYESSGRVQKIVVTWQDLNIYMKQKNIYIWIKWESAKDSRHMARSQPHADKKLSFLKKTVYNILSISVNEHAWELTTSD